MTVHRWSSHATNDMFNNGWVEKMRHWWSPTCYSVLLISSLITGLNALGIPYSSLLVSYDPLWMPSITAHLSDTVKYVLSATVK